MGIVPSVFLIQASMYDLATATHQSEYKEKHVDEVQVEFERSHNTELYLPFPIHAHLRSHAANPLSIIGG